MKNFYLKIVLPTILAILLFVLTIFIIIIPRFQANIMNGKREMIKELTNSAWSILSKYENDERNGLLTREEAQKTSVSRIQYLRYGEENKDYFWITDMHPKMIMHPYRPDLNNNDLTNFTDPLGKKLFVEFVETVKKSGNGYVDYMWQWKDDSLHIVPKLSYVELFEPWGWIIGTGIYIEDVKREIEALTRNLIWISSGISLIIALLLFFMSRQSLKTERKRLEAERDLQESKDKYKTLVEAATEGLIMLSEGKISFLNNVICNMTGYEYYELINHSLKEIIHENNSQNIIDVFSQKIVEEGQYDINLRKKNGGFIEVLVTSSAGMINSKAVNIIIVKDITIDRSSNLSVLDYQKLLSTLNIGFFRASIDYKGRFIFANEVAIKILGYNNFRQLSETHIINLLSSADDKKNLRKNLLENGFIKNKVLKIQKKNKETAFVAITLVLYNNEGSKELICDGIIEDITTQENQKNEINTLIAELKSSSFIIEQTVKDFSIPFYTIDSDSTIKEAIRVLSIRKTDSLILTKSEKDYIGIVTSSDIQHRVLALNLNLDNPVYLIMTSPLISISESTSVFDAINICNEKKVNHLVIKNGADEIYGVLRINDIYKELKNSLTFYTSNVEKANSLEDLKLLYKQLQLLLKPLINGDFSVEIITRITTSFSDSIIRKLIELAISEIGKPPVDFSFICLGSEGRKEETLFTDQDNAIIYEDIQPEIEESVREYFKKLSENVCSSLNYIGYSFCKGNVMAKNQVWCQPISVWEKYFTSWIIAPEPQNLLDATIFFDFRNVYGDVRFTDRLRNTISNQISSRTLFLYHLAYNTFHLKVQHVSSGSILSDKSADQIELKNAVNFIVMFARAYALQNNIWLTNTLERLNALKAKNIIRESSIDEIIFAYNFLMKLRFRNQQNLANNDLPLSNTINTKQLINIELSTLKEVLSIIPIYQKMISVDFRVSS